MYVAVCVYMVVLGPSGLEDLRYYVIGTVLEAGRAHGYLESYPYLPGRHALQVLSAAWTPYPA